MTLHTVQFESRCGYSGYPTSHIRFLRCKSDGGSLQISKASKGLHGFIWDGSLCCQSCGREYQIIEGIVRMLDPQELDEEGAHELRLRDEQSAIAPNFLSTPSAEFWNRLEMGPTLSALALSEDCALLELACGAGRYTVRLIGKCRFFVAVDFSIVSLRALAEQIYSGTEIGLVHVDITRLVLTPQCFDRILSTTCLDNREQRMAMHRLASNALTEKGCYVFSNEFYNLRTRLLGLPRNQRYTPGGMYFCRLEKDDVLRETAPFFKHVQVRPIQVPVPFTRNLGFKWKMILARIAEIIPLVRDMGELLLVRARKPIHQPVEGQYSAGNRVAKAIFRWYGNRQGDTSA